MADFLDEFMREEAPEAPEPQPEAPVETPVEEQALPEPEPAPEAQPAPNPEPEQSREEQRTIPLATALNWRDEAKEYKRKVEQFEAQQRQNTTQPDPFDDPAGFAAHQQSLVQQAIIADRFERSNEEAVEKFGEDKVKAAVEWAGERAKANPGFAAEYMSKTRPIHWIVQQHQRDAMVSEIGDRSMDDFVRDYIARNPGLLPQSAAPVAAVPVAAAVPQPASKPAPPPRSIASDRSPAPVVTPEGERDGFLASFMRK